MSKQEVFEFNQYLSMIDVAKHPRFLEYSKEWDEKILQEMLFDMGADLKLNGYEMTMCEHRPRTTNKVVHCQRFLFTERKDKYWLANGMQTEDIIRNHPSEIVRTGMMLAINAPRNVIREEKASDEENKPQKKLKGEKRV